jgi:hypothetical protein
MHRIDRFIRTNQRDRRTREGCTAFEPETRKEPFMNSIKQLIAAASLIMIGASAFAAEATPDTWMHEARASKTRQEVAAELQAARKDGTVNATSPTYDFVRRVPATKTLGQVRAEVAQSRASGEYQALNGEAHAFGNGLARHPIHASAAAR